jgi:hypothetical protein
MWSTTGSLSAARYAPTATHLPNGQVLVAGGWGNGVYLASAELYDVGLGFSVAWQPTLSAATSPLALGQILTANGIGWRGYGYAEASGSATNNSASNYPLVQLYRLDNGQTTWLPTSSFSATALATLPVTGYAPGHALATVFVNGIPSVAHIIRVDPQIDPPAGLSASNDGPTMLGSVTTLTATVTAGLNVAYNWNFGDGHLGADTIVTHTYAAAGIYPAVVTATNSAGSVMATTTVYVITNPVAQAGPDQTVHTGRSVTLDGGASSDPGNFLPLTYQWQQTGGPSITLSGANHVTATFISPAITQTRVLTFALTVTNTQSLASLPNGVVITVEPYRVMLPLIRK